MNASLGNKPAPGSSSDSGEAPTTVVVHGREAPGESKARPPREQTKPSQTPPVPSNDARPDPGRNRFRGPGTLAAVAVAVFMLPLDYTVVAVALHDIQRDLGASYADLQWVVNGYTLTFAAFLLAGGGLADLLGRRRVFLIGLGVFAASSLACGLASAALALNVARAAQGVGAALLFSAAVLLLVQEFTEPAARARAFGVFGAVVGLGAGLGPLIGGVIVSLAGWRWAFLVNVPVSLAVAALTLVTVRESRDPEAKGVDWGGTVTFTTSCFLLIYALISGNESGWGSRLVLAAFAGSALLLAGFVAVERRRSYPMFDLSLFRNLRFVGVCLPPLVLSTAFWGVFLFAPMYYQVALGYTPFQAGLAVLPFAAPLFVTGPVGGWLAGRISTQRLLALGQLLVGAGSLGLLLANRDSGWRAFALGAAVSGIGTGLINGQMTNAAMSIVPPERSGMASGINGTMRQIGVALGFAGLGAILAAATGAAFAPAAAALHVTAGDSAVLAGFVIKGDLTGGAARLPEALHPAFLEAAHTALFHGFRTIATVAGLVGLGGAAATFALLRGVTAPAAPAASSPALSH